MKKVMVLMMAGLLVVFVGSALAQTAGWRPPCPPPEPPAGQNFDDPTNVFFDVNVTKDVEKTETRTIEKDLSLTVTANITVTEWAQTEVVKCDLNRDNVADTFDVINADAIDGSFAGFVGIAQVNQAAGSLNNQGNVMAAAVTNDANSKAVAHSQAAVEAINLGNTHTSGETSGDSLSDSICNSFAGFQGIAQVNQASGYLNNQNNAASIAATLNGNGLVALSDAFLTMHNAENNYNAYYGERTAAIGNSFNNAAGIAQVNQSPGSMNNQANVVSISYSGYSGPASF